LFRIGLTGGIGSGKSRVASILRKLGAHIVTADDLAREQTVPGSPVLDALAREFGEGVLRPDGTLDRSGLGRLAFSSAERLERLNGITHPPLVEAILRRMEELESEDPGGVLVLDAALLLDWDLGDAFDLVVAVRAPSEVRVGRLVSCDMTEEEALGRIAAQMSDEEFAAASDVVLDNDGSLEDLERKVRNLWDRVTHDPEGERR